MKKYSFIAAAILAAFTLSCQQEEPFQNTETEEEEVVMPEVIYATVADEDTKAGMDRYQDGETYKYRHHWNVGDQMVVYHGHIRDTYHCTDAGTGAFARDASARVNGLYANFTQYCAVFSSTTSPDEFELDKTGHFFGDNCIRIASAHIPTNSEAVYTSSSETPGYGNVMAACSSDGTYYKFTSLLGWLKLQLKGVKTVSSIEVNANYVDPLANSIMIQFPTSGEIISNPTYSETAIDEDALCTLYVTLEKPVQLNATTPTDFYVALPPMSRNLASGLVIRFTDGTSETLTTSKTIPIEANKVTPMAVREVGIVPATLVSGVSFNEALKSFVTGTEHLYPDTDGLIKGICLSTEESAPTATSCNVSATSQYPVYASFDSTTGIVTLHTKANTVYLPANCSYMFQNMKVLESVEFLSDVHTTAITALEQMFSGCDVLATVDLSKLNTAAVTTFNSMFKDCIGLTSLDVTGLNTSSATKLTSMFEKCNHLTSLDVSGFNTAKVKSFDRMFQDCTLLDNLDVTGFQTPQAESFYCMFLRCSSLESIDVTGFNTAKCHNFSYMFGRCTSLTTIGGTFINQSTYLSYTNKLNNMFEGCTSLKSVSLGPVWGGGGNSLAYINSICTGCTSLESFVLNTPALRLSSGMYAFQGCSNVASIDLTGCSMWSDASFKYMFSGCYKLSTLRIRQFSFIMGDASSYYTDMFRYAGRDIPYLYAYVYSQSVANRLQTEAAFGVGSNVILLYP